MLQMFVQQAFFLYLVSLIHSFHCTKYSSPLIDTVKLSEHGFFNKICKFFNQKASLVRVFIFGCAQFAVYDQLDGHCPTHTVFCGSSNGLIISVGMEAVAVIVDCIQCLQRCPDIIKVYFLGMEASTTSLDVVFEFLTALICLVFIFHRL